MSESPVRIQRRRTRGWKMPPNTVCVDRSTRWGNPFIVGVDGTRAECVHLYRALAQGYVCISKGPDHVRRQQVARQAMKDARTTLRGKDLACFCPIGQPCHANVLLEIANSRPEVAR